MLCVLVVCAYARIIHPAIKTMGRHIFPTNHVCPLIAHKKLNELKYQKGSPGTTKFIQGLYIGIILGKKLEESHSILLEKRKKSIPNFNSHVLSNTIINPG